MIHIIVDLHQNVLRLRLRERQVSPSWRARVPAVLDIGEAGALLGLELSLGDSVTLGLAESGRQRDTYLALADETSPLARSAEIEVEIVAGADSQIDEIIVPRRGSTYEISFPSGNQCWIPKRAGSGPRQAIGWCAVVQPGKDYLTT